MSQLKFKQNLLLEATLEELEQLIGAARKAYQTLSAGSGAVLGTFQSKTPEGNEIAISIAVSRETYIDLPSGPLS